MKFTDLISTPLVGSRTYTDEGFLVVPAAISRSGIQVYMALELGLQDRDPEETVNVYRPEDEVFHPDSLKSFANKVVTNDHPASLVDSSNAKELSVGHSGPEVIRDGIYAKTILHIVDAKAIKDIESGKVELSNGYTSDITLEQGVTPEGMKYDAIQRNIKGNHIALVEKGRCGVACKLSDNSPTAEENPMAKITIDGVDFDVSDQAAQAVKKLQNSLRDTEEEVKKQEEEAKKKEDEMEAEKKEDEAKMEKDHKAAVDTLQAKLDDATTKAPTPAQLDVLVENRIATRDAAIKIDPSYKWENKDCETIRKEIVAIACPTVTVDSVSPEYIRARFDALTTSTGTNQLDTALRHQAKHTPLEDGEIVDARTAFSAKTRDAWKGGKV